MTMPQGPDQQLQTDGGALVRTKTLPPWPYYSALEIEAVTRVLQSGKVNYWTGTEGRHFEREYAQYTRTSHAITLANGTLALELALYSLGVGPGDEVITTSRTFIATASCVIMRGAKPVFADVDLDSGNITAESIRPLINSKTKAIIVVHLAGWPCDMDPILSLAEECNLKVIEDCAQAHGSEYKGRPVGSMGDFNAFSFCQDKIITTGGEGGLVTTNDFSLWERAWAYKDHGKSYRAVYHDQHGPGFRWLVESFGTNWRATELQSVLGRLQLTTLNDSVSIRRRNAEILDRGFSAIPSLRLVKPPASIKHSYYKYNVFLRPEMLAPGWNRERIVTAIVAEGIPCSSGGSSEIYLEKAFSPQLRPAHRLPNARVLGDTSLMFLVHPTLTPHDMEDTCVAVRKVLEKATK